MPTQLAQSTMAEKASITGKPFSVQALEVYADRLVRHGILSIALNDPSHPCMEYEDALLAEAETPIRASSDHCRQSPAWPLVRTWFITRMMDLVRERISYYKFPASVTGPVLTSISRAGFDHVLEGGSGTSGVRSIAGSNVLFPRQCKKS